MEESLANKIGLLKKVLLGNEPDLHWPTVEAQPLFFQVSSGDWVKYFLATKRFSDNQ